MNERPVETNLLRRCDLFSRVADKWDAEGQTVFRYASVFLWRDTN